MRLEPGAAFDRYTIEAEIGEGGMGVVYRATDTKLHRSVALKLLRVDAGAIGSSESAEARARLVREARAAASLDHANAVAIFDVGEHEGVPYLAMELVVGRSLRDFVGDSTVSVDRRTRWLADVARALAAAHKRGLVHRDIKPENVMVKDDGGIKVLDFGIARRVQSVDPNAATAAAGLPTITERGVVIGTPVYMAPEQMRGDDLDGRADQFSWGVLAYELTSGRLPWRTGSDAIGIVSQVLSADPEPLAKAAPDLPPAVAAIVMKALAKTRTARFASMDEIVDALDRTTATTDARPAATQRSWRVLAGGVVLLVAGASVALLARRSSDESKLHAAPSASGVASNRSTRFVRSIDLPPPKSDSPAALAAYRDGIQAYRDGAEWAALDGFTRASKLDPSMGAAWLQLLRVHSTSGSPTEEREVYRTAQKTRASLDERDAQILDAFEPRVLSDPPDFAEMRARLERVAERYPGDLDVLGLLAVTELTALDYDASEATVDRVLAADPEDAAAWSTKGNVRAQLNDARGASDAWDRCRRVFAGATVCMDHAAWLAATEGRCEDVAVLARQMTRAEPEAEGGYAFLAVGLAAEGSPVDLVREAAQQEWSRTPEQWKGWTVAMESLQIDFYYGDFAATDRDTNALARLVASDADENSHAVLALYRLALAEEAQDARGAAEIARAFATRRDAWVRKRFFDELPLIEDPLVPMVAAEARAKLVAPSAVDDARAKWVAGWTTEMTPPKTGYLWLHGWALPARTADDARAALAARSGFAPLPLPVKYTWYGPGYEAEAGKVLLLAGRAAEAIEPLARGAGACDGYMFPVEKVRSYLWLGQAREATSDSTGACAAYAEVIRRWGAAKARSVTARTAIERSTALHCAR